MLNQISSTRLFLGSSILSVVFIFILNYMVYYAFTEYTTLSKSEWTEIRLDTSDHPYSIQEFKKEDKLFIENTFPDFQNFEIYCDSKLFEMCHLILTNQIKIHHFLMDLGRMPNHQFTLRLKEIHYIDQNQQLQNFIYTHTPANSEAKIQRQFKIALGSSSLSILGLFGLLSLFYRSKDLNIHFKSFIIFCVLVNILGLGYFSFKVLI